MARLGWGAHEGLTLRARIPDCESSAEDDETLPSILEQWPVHKGNHDHDLFPSVPNIYESTVRLKKSSYGMPNQPCCLVTFWHGSWAQKMPRGLPPPPPLLGIKVVSSRRGQVYVAGLQNIRRIWGVSNFKMGWWDDVYTTQNSYTATRSNELDIRPDNMGVNDSKKRWDYVMLLPKKNGFQKNLWENGMSYKIPFTFPLYPVPKSLKHAKHVRNV